MRIGLIGAGAVAKSHADAAAGLANAHIAAVCDLNRQTAEAVARPHQARVHTDYRELIAAGGLDAVIINTPHALHHEMVLAAAAAGLHVLVEKPMATSVADCHEMITACAQAGVQLAVGHIQHFLPDKTAARRAIQAGRIGEVLLVHDYRSTDYRPGTRPDWFFDAEISGGGALMNIGAHMIDRSSWLAGGLPESVDAVLQYRFGVGVETDGTLRLRMSNGVTAALTVISTTPQNLDEVHVVGTEGTIVADPRRGTVLRTESGIEHLYHAGEDDIPTAFARQLESFARLVSDGAEFPVSAELSTAVIAAVQAAYQSARTAGRAPVAGIRAGV